MCGIIGYLSANPTPENFRPVIDVFRESKIRGMHAYGYAALSQGLQIRKFLELEELLTDLEKLALKPPKALIGHARYSTSGDYGDHANNQPIVSSDPMTEPPFALVFNGVIDMGTRGDMMARHGVFIWSANDGELALRWLEQGQQTFYDNLRESTGRSFAGIFLSTNGEMRIFRNSLRPMYWLQTDEAHYFASTRDILARAGLNAHDADEVTPGLLWSLSV